MRTVEIGHGASRRKCSRETEFIQTDSLDLLVDSPVITGEFYRSIDSRRQANPSIMKSTSLQTAQML